MPEKEWSPNDVFDVVGDRLARRILVLASDDALSADDLAEHLGVSRPTVYRRVNALVDYDLLTERQTIDAEGNHYQVFETMLSQITFEIDSGGYSVDVKIRRSLADQFESFWNDLEESATAPDQHPDKRHDTDPTEP